MPLLVLGIGGANDVELPPSFDDFAMLADPFHAGSNFHDSPRSLSASITTDDTIGADELNQSATYSTRVRCRIPTKILSWPPDCKTVPAIFREETASRVWQKFLASGGL